jgi:hypothetical protein
MMRTDKERAEADGMIVDTHVYPWFAYTGPRFAPQRSRQIRTDLECQLLPLHSALGNLIGLVDLVSNRDDIIPELKAVLLAGWRINDARDAFGRVQPLLKRQ